jgi:hypothetical protein
VWAASDGSDRGIFGQRYDSAGLPVGGEFQANVDTANEQFSPAVAGADGFVVVWFGNGRDARLFDAAGVPLGDGFDVAFSAPSGAARS